MRDWRALEKRALDGDLKAVVEIISALRVYRNSVRTMLDTDYSMPGSAMMELDQEITELEETP